MGVMEVTSSSGTTIMKTHFVLTFAVASLCVAGCGKEERAPENKQPGIQINAPGTNIKIDPETGVEIEAPGVKIKSDSEGKTEVDAPGTDVKVE